jgi:hypothetical protein
VLNAQESLNQGPAGEVYDHAYFVRAYDNYPPHLIGAMMGVFATKSGNALVAARIATMQTPHTQAQLTEIATMCTVPELANVGV